MGLGTRLREERERLGWSQADFAAFAGASRKSQIRWEQDASYPDAAALAALAAKGVDVQYVITGVRSLNAEEAEKFARDGAFEPTDPRLLLSAMEMVDKELQRRDEKMTPAQRAEFVRSAYRQLEHHLGGKIEPIGEWLRRRGVPLTADEKSRAQSDTLGSADRDDDQ